MSNKSQKGFNGTPKARTRRQNAIARLEEQLNVKVKQVKVEGKNVTAPLTDSDMERIKKELTTLKARS